MIRHIYDTGVLVFLTLLLHAGSTSNSWDRCLSEFKEETVKTKDQTVLSVQVSEGTFFC